MAPPWNPRPRTPQHATRGAAISAIVDRAIDEFDLARASNSPVMASVGQGGISGGEKRRLVIAMECVHRPKVLLLDEPSECRPGRHQALLVVQLRSIGGRRARGHRAAVITSIHQVYRSSIMPSSSTRASSSPTAGRGNRPIIRAARDRDALSRDGVMGWLKEVGYPFQMYRLWD